MERVCDKSDARLFQLVVSPCLLHRHLHLAHTMAVYVCCCFNILVLASIMLEWSCKVSCCCKLSLITVAYLWCKIKMFMMVRYFPAYQLDSSFVFSS